MTSSRFAIPRATRGRGSGRRVYQRTQLVTMVVVATLLIPGAIMGLSGAQAGAIGGDPIGNLEGPSVRLGHTNGGFVYAIEGWAADSDTPGQATTVHLYVDGRFYLAVTTGRARPDVEAAYPWAGPNAGFESGISNRYLTFGTAPVTICAYAINAGAGTTNTTLGCQVIPVDGTDGGEPIGALDETTATAGLVRLRGWAGDRDAGNETVQVRVYIDGAPMVSMMADKSRPDVAVAFPTLAVTTGFDDQIPVEPGTHTICAYAGNRGRAGLSNTTLGCTTVDVAGATVVGANDPRGNLDIISTYSSSGMFPLYFAKGWAFDPDSPGPWTVRLRAIYGDSFQMMTMPVWASEVLTSKPRPDVEAVYPAAGPTSGYDGAISPGKYRGVVYACAYAVQVPPGAVAETFLGCRTPTL